MSFEGNALLDQLRGFMSSVNGLAPVATNLAHDERLAEVLFGDDPDDVVRAGGFGLDGARDEQAIRALRRVTGRELDGDPAAWKKFARGL